MPAHLRPSAPTASRALLCGDPGRTLAIAQRVLVKPRMSNHHRGLWGYFGETASGMELTVQSLGIGGPSAAVVLGELAELGLQAAVRIGTCISWTPRLPAGSGLVVGAAVAADGTSAALGTPPGTAVATDRELTELLTSSLAAEAVEVLSRDVLGNPPPVTDAPPPEVGDLQTAPFIVASRALGIAPAALLVVGESGGRRLEDEPVDARSIELADGAATVLEDSASTRG